MGLFSRGASASTPKAPEILDNVNHKVIDDLRQTIRKGSRVSIAAASFSIYAFEALKKELKNVDELRFLFTGDTFTKEKIPKEAREFYIPRLDRERSLYGTNFEVRLRNELNQQAIAKECADWIRKKAHFRSNISGATMMPFMNVENPEEDITYNPFANFTTAELGEDRGNNAVNGDGPKLEAGAVIAMSGSNLDNRDGNTSYYYLSSERELTSLTLEDIKSKLDDGTFEYIERKDPKIPGTVEPDEGKGE